MRQGPSDGDLSIAVIVLGHDGRVTGLSDVVLSLLGVEALEQVVERPIADLFVPEDRATVDSAIANPRSTVMLGRLRNESSGGSVEVCISVDPRGTDERRVLLHPLDQRCPLSGRMTLLEQQQVELFESLQVGVVVQGPSAEMLRWNQKALELLGLTEGQVTGRTSFDPRWNVIHADGSEFPGPTHPVPVAIATRKPVRGVVMGVYRPSSGDRVWLLVDAQPRLDEADEVKDVVCTFTDITAQRILSDELARAQKHELVARLAGGVAHDFNNMLAVIMAVAELQMELMDEGEDKTCLQEILDAAQRGSLLTRRLLAVAGKTVDTCQRAWLDRGVEFMHPLLRRAVGERVVVRLELGAREAIIEVRHSHFEQAILNLVLNARDAMPHGGEIVIQTRMADDGEATIEVIDSGEGIPEEIVPHIFEPFFTTKPGDRGTGLGLFSVRDFVQSAGGEVSFKTSPKGTTFTLTLPCEHGEGGGKTVLPRDKRPQRNAFPSRGERILVVDNDTAVRTALSQSLRHAGYDVMVATDGERALVVLAENAIDLLITDIVMPAMDGMTLVARARHEQPDLPVLYISGFVGDHVDDLSQMARGSRFLAKPFSNAKLLAAVGELLREGKRHEEGASGHC